MVIRLINSQDAQAYRALCLALDGESDFRLYAPGERATQLSGFEDEILRYSNMPQSAIIVAQSEETGELVGYLQAIGRPQLRIRHVVSINIGILRSYTGQGLGGQLFAYLEAWAHKNGVLRLDLTVMANNPNAQKLYQRLGFQTEGIKKRSMRFDDTFIDEIYMSKWLGERLNAN